MQKILVADDETRLVHLVRTYLEQAGYRVIVAYDGAQALAQFERQTPDLIVLDLNMPELDGLEVARRIRHQSNVPIIMLTARSEETDRVLGLELGADDYVVKPFSLRELVARVRAVLRRGADAPVARRLDFGRLQIDVEKHQVTLDQEPVELTPSEFSLLQTMAQQPGRVFSRRQLLKAIADVGYATVERAIDMHVMNVRHKLGENPAHPTFLHTVRALGYKFQVEERG